jgi:hypothetical protein
VSQKTDRKELRQPDEFQVVAGKAMEWMIARRQLLLGVGGAVVVLSLAGWGASAYAESREEKAGAELSDALELQGRPIAGEPSAPGSETFATKDERTKAVQSALEKVRADYSSAEAARTAGAELGFLKLRNGDSAGAAPLLAEYVDKGQKDDPLRAVAIEALGAAQENQGKLDEAKATYARLAEVGAPERAAYEQARILLVQGKPEAKAELEKVAKEYAKDTVATQAQRQLELASLPPAPPPGATQPAAPEEKAAPAKGKPAPAKGKAPSKKG